MKRTNKIPVALTTAALLLLGNNALAGEGRYQAHWNGKSYLIMDTDNGHMWTYFGDTMMYNGRIDGDEFVSPEEIKIYQQSHGKWIKK